MYRMTLSMINNNQKCIVRLAFVFFRLLWSILGVMFVFNSFQSIACSGATRLLCRIVSVFDVLLT